MSLRPTPNSVKDGFRTLATLAIGFGVAMPPAGLALFSSAMRRSDGWSWCRWCASSAVRFGFVALRLMRRWG